MWFVLDGADLATSVPEGEQGKSLAGREANLEASLLLGQRPSKNLEFRSQFVAGRWGSRRVTI